ALINGLVIGGLVGLVALVWFRDPVLSLVFALSLVVTLLTAALAGVAVPPLPRGMRVGPAVAGAEVVIAGTDVMGFLGYLGRAQLVLLRWAAARSGPMRQRFLRPFRPCARLLAALLLAACTSLPEHAVQGGFVERQVAVDGASHRYRVFVPARAATGDDGRPP